ncbi:hypothetical protein SGLAM104S_03869 [Streptomyces glaucescens]
MADTDRATDAMADAAYQPTGTNQEQEDAAPLDLQDALDERTYDDTLDEGYSPPEKPLGVTKYGTTAAEQHRARASTSGSPRRCRTPEAAADDMRATCRAADGEPVDPEAGGARAGRLVAPDEGAHTDTTRNRSPRTWASTGAPRAPRRPRCTSTDDDMTTPVDEETP